MPNIANFVHTFNIDFAAKIERCNNFIWIFYAKNGQHFIFNIDFWRQNWKENWLSVLVLKLEDKLDILSGLVQFIHFPKASVRRRHSFTKDNKLNVNQHSWISSTPTLDGYKNNPIFKKIQTVFWTMIFCSC